MDRPHADGTGSQDVVPQPVADEDRLGRLHVERLEDHVEGVRVRLGHRQLAGVDRGVDEAIEVVAGEHLLVVAAGPHRVAQDAHEVAAVLEGGHDLPGIRVGIGVRSPEVEVAPQRPQVPGSVDVDPLGEEERVERPRADRAVGLALRAPQLVLALAQPPGERGCADRVVDLGVRVPLRHEVDVVPGGERAAPVEDHRADRHVSPPRRPGGRGRPPPSPPQGPCDHPSDGP